MIAVIGMGRVGLPLALSFAIKGVKVFGVEKSEATLKTLRNGFTPFYEPGMQEALNNTNNITFVSDSKADFSKCDIIIVAVGTPLRENYLPDMSLIFNVVTNVAKKASDGSIIVLRSTMAPGTTENQIIPVVKKINKTLKVAVCPERIVEGKAMEEVVKLPEIIGVNEDGVSDKLENLLKILGDKEIAVTDIKTAETVKVFTNIYRYVNFALANEFAIVAENLGIDATEAIKLANGGYSRSKIPTPGTAAGPCLRKDALFLPNNSVFSVTKSAWMLNESIPSHIIDSIERKIGSLFGAKVGILGVTYKANIDDIRDSPTLRLIEELKNKGANVIFFDPHTSNIYTMDEVLNSDVIILAVNHSEFDTITAEQLSKAKLVYDVWGQFAKLKLKSYLSLGKK